MMRTSSAPKAYQPAGSAGRDMALNAFKTGVWRVRKGGEFRTHRMACRTTELRGLHVFDCAVCDLCADDNVHQRGNSKEPSQPPKSCFAIELTFGESPPDGAPPEVNANRNQRQTDEKNRRQDQEDHNPDIGIVMVTPNLHGQNKKPGEPGGRHQP